MPILAIWSVIKALPWKYIGAALAILALATLIYRAPWAEHRQKAKDDLVIAARDSTIANMNAAIVKSTADNVAHVAAVKAADEQIRKEQTDAISTDLANARAVAARYASLHHPTADQGHASGDSLPQAPNAPSTAPSASSEAIVPSDDLDRCAQAYVIATGWQSWWAKVSAVQPQ